MRRTSLAALALYVAVSFAYFGARLLPHPGNSYVGYQVDPQIFIWSIAWWPHAILHGQNPIVTHAIWTPVGVNLAWATSVPGLAIPLTPVTLLFGPVVAYDTAAVLLPALAAWTAFLLCRRVTGATAPSLVGGYLFGFSSYMLGQELGHLHMTSVFLVPLVALTALRFVDGTSGARRFAVELGLLLGAQLTLSTEVLFTVSVALAAAIGIAFAVAPVRRPRLRALGRPLAAAYAIAAVVAAPLVVYAIDGWEHGSINPPSGFSADLLNFVFPTGLELASGSWFTTFATRFPGNVSERGAYLGIPLLVVILLYARAHRRERGARFLLSALVLACVAALGTALHVAGHRIVPLPWAAIARLPAFDNTLPSRFALYAALAAAVIGASWLATSPVSAGVRAAVAALAVLALVPDVRLDVWNEVVHRPAFFADGIYRSCLAPDESVVILPYGGNGDSMLLQAEAKFRFRMAGGYVRPDAPKAFRHLPAVIAFSDPDDADKATPAQLARFMRAHGVGAVLEDERAGDKWGKLLAPIGERRVIGGMIVYAAALPAGCARASK